MGVWGTGYRENDDYLDYRQEFAEPPIEALRNRMEEVKQRLHRDGSKAKVRSVADLAIYDLRGQLMFTFHLLSAPDSDVSPNKGTTLGAGDGRLVYHPHGQE